MAPQETKPLEDKYYEDIHLASHLEDGIKEESIFTWLIYWGDIPTRTNRDSERAAEA